MLPAKSRKRGTNEMHKKTATAGLHRAGRNTKTQRYTHVQQQVTVHHMDAARVIFADEVCPVTAQRGIIQRTRSSSSNINEGRCNQCHTQPTLLYVCGGEPAMLLGHNGNPQCRHVTHTAQMHERRSTTCANGRIEHQNMSNVPAYQEIGEDYTRNAMPEK
jgi:hypothetical protein